MKKTIIKQDGSTEVVEGTPEEVAEYERKVNSRPQNETPVPKTPGLLTDELVRKLSETGILDWYRSIPQPAPVMQHTPTCEITVAQRGWWSVSPPRCTCGMFLYPDPQIGTWTTSTKLIAEFPDVQSLPGCMGRPQS